MTRILVRSVQFTTIKTHICILLPLKFLILCFIHITYDIRNNHSFEVKEIVKILKAKTVVDIHQYAFFTVQRYPDMTIAVNSNQPTFRVQK